MIFLIKFRFLALELNEEVVEGGHISEFFKIIPIYVGISKYSPVLFAEAYNETLG